MSTLFVSQGKAIPDQVVRQFVTQATRLTAMATPI